MAPAVDILARSLRGGAIMFLAQAMRFAMQIAATVILARLLLPEAFGLIAMIVALTAILELFREFGLSAATIQRPEISQQQLSTLFWINVGLGVFISGALIIAAPAIAAFYNHPELIGITRWLAVGFFFSALTVQHWALLRRRMRFSAIAALETGSDAAALLSAIALAWLGFGYWALVVQRVVSPLLGLIGSVLLTRWMPGLPRRTPELRELLGFGASVTGYNLVAVAARNVDQVIVGSLWGPAILGLYERAAKLLIVPLNNLNAPIYAVAMPAFSRLTEDKEAYRRLFVAMIERFAMITMLPAVLIAMSADWVTVLLFGARWIDAAPFVACFALAAVYLPVTMSLALLYLTQNRPAEMLRAGLIDAVAAMAILAVGVPFGAIGLALAQALGGILIRLPLALWLSGRKGLVSSKPLAGALLPSLAAASVAASSIAALRWFNPLQSMSASASIAVCSVLGLIVGLVVFALIPRSRDVLLNLIPKQGGNPAPKPLSPEMRSQIVPPTRMPS